MQAPGEDHLRASFGRELEGHGLLGIHFARKAVYVHFRNFRLQGASKPLDTEALVMLFQ